MSDITRRHLLRSVPAVGLIAAVPAVAAMVETPDEALERHVRAITALFEAHTGCPCLGQVNRLSGRYGPLVMLVPAGKGKPGRITWSA